MGLAFALVLWPLGLAAAAFLLPSARWRPWLLPLGGGVRLALTAAALPRSDVAALSGWMQLDALGKVLLLLVDVLFFVCALYAPAYLKLRASRDNRTFCACLLVFLGTSAVVAQAHHLGLLWVAIETSVLASAPLLYFDRNTRSLEATWKYLLIGSVGIALALLGSFFLAYSAVHGGLGSSLLVEDLVRDAPKLSPAWLHAAFIFLFVGYGTKMGLAPMHTWKPDAYGEAPGLVGTLLAGGLTGCAFLAVLRFFQICQAAGQAAFARQMMIAVGLLSMVVAGAFMVRQRDYKRMLAYSSVEHMGILVLGVGVGGGAMFGALLHLLNNGLTKGVLFLCAGNIHRAFRSKLTTEVSGALRRVPASGALFLAGFFAITGTPPFGPFISELTILRAAMRGDQVWVAAAFLVALTVVFLGMGANVLHIVQGEPRADRPATGFRDTALTV
ncbi:MAG TPA: proton-conducting transporter membrane subunit, partial [Myxococcales bacterium]|nr:proton-conducting transporter membrane subunit [Myxococcales bacterium]